jgi:hypothetical protein
MENLTKGYRSARRALEQDGVAVELFECHTNDSGEWCVHSKKDLFF